MTTVVLWADRFDECRDFYKNLLGASLTDESFEFVNISGEFGSVLLHRVPAEWASDTSLPAEAREDSPIKPVFQVESISEARAGVNGSGGSFFDTTREQNYGMATYCDGLDPDGNVIQIFESAS